MKRLLLVLLGVTCCFPLFAQYDFPTEETREMVVSTVSEKFHNYYISLQRAPKPSADGEYVFYIYSQTSSRQDHARFQFHLGTGVEESLQTLGALRDLLAEPVETVESFQNYKSRSDVKVTASRRQGNVLRIQNEGQTGYVYITRQTIDIMDDALRHWDDETATAFAKKDCPDTKSINSEINLYKNRLDKRKSPTDYSPSYKKLFRTRIRQYKQDLKTK